MNNKCSTCGYVFKFDDGDICPECLAPRAETVSCEELHSHTNYYSQSSWENAGKITDTNHIKKPYFKTVIIILFITVTALIILFFSFQKNKNETYDSDQINISADFNQKVEADKYTITFYNLTREGKSSGEMTADDGKVFYSADAEVTINNDSYLNNTYTFFNIYLENIDSESEYHEKYDILPYAQGLLENQIPSTIITPRSSEITGRIYFQVSEDVQNLVLCLITSEYKEKVYKTYKYTIQ